MQESEIIAEIPKSSEELSEHQLILADELEKVTGIANESSRASALVNNLNKNLFIIW